MVDNLAMDANPGDPQSVIDQFAAGIPLKRLGTPEDIGHITAYLASDEASFITGASIVIDGGCVLPETKTLD
jgi:NAD(P)-dependent dehydrogenase (short-subunit alcohol dehydrogenase family)